METFGQCQNCQYPSNFLIHRDINKALLGDFTEKKDRVESKVFGDFPQMFEHTMKFLQQLNASIDQAYADHSHTFYMMHYILRWGENWGVNSTVSMYAPAWSRPPPTKTDEYMQTGSHTYTRTRAHSCTLIYMINNYFSLSAM